jgi:hypothetical protein
MKTYIVKWWDELSMAWKLEIVTATGPTMAMKQLYGLEYANSAGFGWWVEQRRVKAFYIGRAGENIEVVR